MYSLGMNLRLAELTGPGAEHVVRREIAAVDELQRADQIVAEHVAAAAVIGERRQAT